MLSSSTFHLVFPEIYLDVGSRVHPLLQLALWVLFQNRLYLLRPSYDGAFQQRYSILPAGCSSGIHRRHRQPRLPLNLTAENCRARKETVESVHDLAGRHLPPPGLVLRV